MNYENNYYEALESYLIDDSDVYMLADENYDYDEYDVYGIADEGFIDTIISGVKKIIEWIKEKISHAIKWLKNFLFSKKSKNKDEDKDKSDQKNQASSSASKVTANTISAKILKELDTLLSSLKAVKHNIQILDGENPQLDAATYLVGVGIGKEYIDILDDIKDEIDKADDKGIDLKTYTDINKIEEIVRKLDVLYKDVDTLHKTLLSSNPGIGGDKASNGTTMMVRHVKQNLSQVNSILLVIYSAYGIPKR